MKLSREWVLTLLAVSVLFVGWFVWSIAETGKQALPTTVQDLPTFLREMPEPQSVHRIDIGGQSYYEVIGPMASTMALPSGPPVYIFADDLAIVDWTIDRGEDSRFEEQWRASDREAVSIERLRDELGIDTR